MAYRLKHYRKIEGIINAETGLRIGGSTEDIDIGAMENPVIRHPLTGYPYVPGSSLKGKIRSLLEYKHGRRNYQRDRRTKQLVEIELGEPCMCGECIVCRVFGPHKNVDHQLGPTRAIFRDADLTEESRKRLEEARAETGMFYTETKKENIIDRRTGVAADRGLRTQERVPAGTKFDFEISVRIFDDDNEQEILDFIEEGLALLQQDYLGGSGSRGYGKVSLEYQVN
ncbi:MAG: type III-A CRISPR-associated RAMP protein Csm3 [Anaerolineales bacterium]|nr:type III-A CRISPR-associated RAMP protein Csm3 [Anaerolineales bacterium]